MLLTDVDPCDVANGGCDHDCVHLNGTDYVCRCWKGWSFDANKFTCLGKSELKQLISEPFPLNLVVLLCHTS